MRFTISQSGKGKTWDGGIRVPAIAYWPGHISPGQTSRALLSTTDILPTVAELTHGVVPSDRTIDGNPPVHIRLTFHVYLSGFQLRSLVCLSAQLFIFIDSVLGHLTRSDNSLRRELA